MEYEYIIQYNTEKDAEDDNDDWGDRIPDQGIPVISSKIKGSSIILKLGAALNTVDDIDIPKNVAISPIIRLNILETYYQNYKRGRYSDLKIKVNDSNGTIKIFNLHKILLVSSSSYFDDIFDIETFDLDEIFLEYNAHLFRKIINIIYGKPVKLIGSKGIKILQAVSFFGIFDLNTELYVSSIFPPDPDDFLNFLTECYVLFPDSIGYFLTNSIEHHIRHYRVKLKIADLEFYYEIWKLLNYKMPFMNKRNKKSWMKIIKYIEKIMDKIDEGWRSREEVININFS